MVGAVPAPGNIEYIEPEPEQDPLAMPRTSAFDGGARQPVAPPSDPAREHAELLVAMAAPESRGATRCTGAGLEAWADPRPHSRI
jgi:hypothetical protein